MPNAYETLLMVYLMVWYMHSPHQLSYTPLVRRPRGEETIEGRLYQDTAQHGDISSSRDESKKPLYTIRVAIQIFLRSHEAKGLAIRDLGNNIQGKVPDEVRKVERLESTCRREIPGPEDGHEMLYHAINSRLKSHPGASAIAMRGLSLASIMRPDLDGAEEIVMVGVHLGRSIPFIPVGRAPSTVHLLHHLRIIRENIIRSYANQGPVFPQVLVLHTAAPYYLACHP